ncbi:TPR domain protein [Dactylonectria macrodidyma]|uniref:TPR domain protein n=1 Tax=Dactylonectria macrodidyma TaxID=307937 RepID=A0A9P9DUE2_9HYPO|nr:TPR domain protein [Dactylonectria macrodidyma]
MDASTHFHDTVSGQTTIAAPQASHGGSNNFHFYGPGAPAAAAGRNPPKPRKPFSTVPFPPDPDFVDRPDILKWMHEKCARPAARIALVGLGGIGKSQLAIQYAHQVRQRVPNTWVFWVHASTRGRFEEAYRSIADRLELPRRNDPDVNICRLVSEWLRVEENGPWKMILDNADDVGVFFLNAQKRLASFLPQSCNGSIVVTSRSMDVAERLVGSWSNILTIPAMKTEEACQLLREKLGVSYDDGAAADLVRDLNHMPLAITQAAAFINRRAPRMSIPAYLNEFRRSDKKKASLLNKDVGDLRRDESASNSIVTTWQITFEQIRHERPSAANMLSFMSFFNPQGIPESVLQAYACEYGEYGEDGFDQDVETLRGYSLVAVTADKEILKMHALVQFCTQIWLSSSSNMQQWEREFLKVMSDQYPSGEYKNWTECQRLDPHIDIIVKEEPSNNEDVLRWARLLTNAGWYRWMKGTYEEAEQMNRRALDAKEKVLSREHPDTLMSVHFLALVLQYQGKYEEAEQMNRRALDACEKVLGGEHPNTLTSVSNLASVLQSQGKYEEAEQMNRRALDAQEKVLGREHPDTLTSVSNLALVLRYQGKYEEAEQMNRRALDACEKVLGGEHPNTLMSVSNLASVLQSQGKYEEAEQMNRGALDAREKVLGGEHPNTLTSVSNLASVLQSQGKYEEAEQMNRRALDACEKVLGREHPDTLTSVSNLALVLRYQGKYEEAEQMNRRALDSSEKVLGREHPSTLTSVSNLAGVLRCQGKYEEAEQMNRRALDAREKVLGGEHPDTLMSASNLASVLQYQGKYEEAEQMNRRALYSREKVLGREHPDTLTSVNNLALVLRDQGEYDESEHMNRRALDSSEKVLGREHPDTLTSVYNLACLFHRQTRFLEAAKLYERACNGCVEVLGSDHPTTRAWAAHYCSFREDMENDHVH